MIQLQVELTVEKPDGEMTSFEEVYIVHVGECCIHFPRQMGEAMGHALEAGAVVRIRKTKE